MIIMEDGSSEDPMNEDLNLSPLSIALSEVPGFLSEVPEFRRIRRFRSRALRNQTLLQVMASLMAAIASVIQSFLPLLDATNLLASHTFPASAHMQKDVLFRHLIPVFLHIVGIAHVRPREIYSRWYIKPRTMHRFMLWMDDSPQEDPQRFREFFRIGPDLFFYLCELLHVDMLTDPPESLTILPNRKLVVMRQVALALRRLAVGDTFLTLGELFGVSKTTAVKVTWKFIQALRQRARNVVSWPGAVGLIEIKAAFESQWGFPNCCGAIDGTHFPIELPAGEDSTQYYDWKHKLSVSMQVICDHKLRFLDVFCGLPGSIQDTRLMRLSRFYTEVTQYQSRLNGPAFQCLNGDQIKEYILGDAGYPLMPWLIVPYPRGVSRDTDHFNYIHSSTRMCVERCLGRLKGTWRILNRILWKPKITRIGPIIYACCILHNLIIDKNDPLPNAVWQNIPAHPPGYPSVLRPNMQMYAGGPEARDVLFHYLID